jgi:predicted DNA binding CopG/RHH family protein
VATMKKRYDFSEARPNPYAKRLKKQVTIRLDQESLAYFQKLADETGIPYQTLINLYLKECAASGKRLQLLWRAKAAGGA